jgi:hypothetical protein
MVNLKWPQYRDCKTPLNMGDSVAVVVSTSDREYTSNNEGFHTVDSMSKVSRRQNYGRVYFLSLEDREICWIQ